MLKLPLHSMRRRAIGRATAVALLLATGYAAWAAQPAQPSVSMVPAGKIAADIALRVDEGEPVHLRVIADAGVPFSVDARQGGKRYVLASTVNRWQVDGRRVLRMKMRLTEDGKVLTEPGIAVESGKTAQIHVGEEIAGSAGRTTFKGVRLDIALTDSMPVAVDRAKREPAGANATASNRKPLAERPAVASTMGNFNTYERMLTSFSASWEPPKPVEDGC